MELRHLQYFIAVAEERHFTRAAARVGIQQPPLSLQIRQLETELGGPLFMRLPRDVVLTELGEAFLPEARQILERVARVKRRMQQISRGEAGQIRIGFAGATYFEPRIPAWIRDFRARCPDVQLHPQQSNTASLLTALLDEAIDVAFVRTPFEVPEGIVSVPVVDEPMMVVLPLGHAMCARERVPLAALAQDEFILLPREISPALYDRMIAACEAAGFRPKLGQEAPQITSIVPMVAAGFGVSLVPASVSQIRTPGMGFWPIEGDVPLAPISLAYRADHSSAALDRFIAMAPADSPDSGDSASPAP
ncbi:LysR family transcriptional regulator [Pandoraea communis]|uniref:Hca operon transcriptional activator HcaR n=1 Tax=Pandoraea communis TaxID=2508297 RepID=A0A5E4YUD1_9BURK|nr:LysR family transcriptional regulator [Pandoraea communis]MDM8356749.1 LysR family transcriptional regulator [Pandoraea communis]VVE52102.1 Hca operon transcriptional activator HcaR [Pandoraea communis]